MNFIQKNLIGSIIIVVIVLALIIWLAVYHSRKIKYLSQEYLSNQGILAQIDTKEFLLKI